MSTVHEKSAACLRAFTTLCSSLEAESVEPEYLEQMPLRTIENERSRFKVWCSNLGALQDGPGGLDQLAGAEDLRTDLIMFLLDLLDELEQSIAVVRGDRLPYELQPAISGTDSEDSDSDGDGSEAGSDMIIHAPDKELQLRRSSIVDLMARLYSVSYKINTARYSIKSTAALQSEASSFDDSDPFSRYGYTDRRYVEEVIAISRTAAFRPSQAKEDADLPLRERLAAAITMRRRRFSHLQQHSGEHAVDEAMRSSKAAMAAAAGRGDGRHAGSPEISPSGPPTAAAVHFEAPADDTLHVLCKGTIQGGTSTPKYDLGLPPLPAEAESYTGFTCPYCHMHVPAEHNKELAWQAHVLQDLQPFICTYAECTEPLRTYARLSQWLEHEGLAHRRVWRCPQHKSVVFGSKRRFRGHLASCHRQLGEAEVAGLLQLSSSYAPDPRKLCPVCRNRFGTEESFQLHVARHLVRVAIFALSPPLCLSADKVLGDSVFSQCFITEQQRPFVFDRSGRILISTDALLTEDGKRVESTHRYSARKHVSVEEAVRSAFTLSESSARASTETAMPQSPDERATLASMSKSAIELRVEGNLFLADLKCRRALGGWEHELGADSPITLLSLSHLGLVHRDNGNFELAERLCRRALEKAPGGDSLIPLYCQGHLALVLLARRKLSDAEHASQRVEAGMEKLLGRSHPDTLTSMLYRAVVLRELGNSQSAEALNRVAWFEMVESLGLEHPLTLTCQANYGLALLAQWKLLDAETMTQTAFKGMTRVLGPAHPDTMMCLSNLATMLRAQKRYDEAEIMHQTVLTRRTEALDENHPHVQQSIANLFEIRQQKHKRVEDDQRRQRDLEIPVADFSANPYSVPEESVRRYAEKIRGVGA